LAEVVAGLTSGATFGLSAKDGNENIVAASNMLVRREIFIKNHPLLVKNIDIQNSLAALLHILRLLAIVSRACRHELAIC